MRHKLFYFILALALMLQFGCDRNRWEVNTSSSELSIEVKRFERDLFERTANASITKEEREKLKQDYPQLLPLYFQGIMQFGGLREEQTWQGLIQFTSNEDIKSLYQAVEKEFPENSLDEESALLTKGFIRYQHFFPNRLIPQAATMISAFNYSIAADDSLLVIGLDNYLGEEFKVYAKTGIPKYKFKQFDRKYLVSDALKAWFTTEFEEEGGKNMLDQMIFQGKILYLLNAFLPEIDQSVFFNYTPEELAWCEENESQIWFHFVDMDLLYTIENFQLRKYMGDAPFISGFPEGSPGRVGQWVGFQLVSAYMENNKNKSLHDLMQLRDANKILQQSNYKPRR